MSVNNTSSAALVMQKAKDYYGHYGQYFKPGSTDTALKVSTILSNLSQFAFALDRFDRQVDPGLKPVQ